MREKSTVFALIGDRAHNSDYIRTALRKTLVRDLGVTIDFTDEVQMLNAATLGGYQMLIIFRDDALWPDGYRANTFWPGSQTRDPRVHPFEYQQRADSDYQTLMSLPIISDPPLPEREVRKVDWMTAEQAIGVKDFVESGGAALFYHNSTYIARGNRTFREVLGAATEGHPPVRPFKVQIRNANHPITRGIRNFIVTDEQHFVTYDKAPAFVLMRSVNEDGLTHKDLGTSCEAEWAYDYGKGRVCYLAPGHTIPALWNPEYEKIQQNAVRWLLKEI